jgi:hypothetical protein
VCDGVAVPSFGQHADRHDAADVSPWRMKWVLALRRQLLEALGVDRPALRIARPRRFANCVEREADPLRFLALRVPVSVSLTTFESTRIVLMRSAVFRKPGIFAGGTPMGGLFSPSLVGLVEGRTDDRLLDFELVHGAVLFGTRSRIAPEMLCAISMACFAISSLGSSVVSG